LVQPGVLCPSIKASAPSPRGPSSGASRCIRCMRTASPPPMDGSEPIAAATPSRKATWGEGALLNWSSTLTTPPGRRRTARRGGAWRSSSRPGRRATGSSSPQRSIARRPRVRRSSRALRTRTHTRAYITFATRFLAGALLNTHTLPEDSRARRCRRAPAAVAPSRIRTNSAAARLAKAAAASEACPPRISDDRARASRRRRVRARRLGATAAGARRLRAREAGPRRGGQARGRGNTRGQPDAGCGRGVPAPVGQRVRRVARTAVGRELVMPNPAGGQRTRGQLPAGLHVRRGHRPPRGGRRTRGKRPARREAGAAAGRPRSPALLLARHVQPPSPPSGVNAPRRGQLHPAPELREGRWPAARCAPPTPSRGGNPQPRGGTPGRVIPRPPLASAPLGWPKV
jgi:hypothetical protein